MKKDKKEKKEKFKTFLLKCLFDKQTNDFVVSMFYLPFLILGLVTSMKYWIILGGLIVVILNVIIKKVVSAHIFQGNKPNDENKKGGSTELGA